MNLKASELRKAMHHGVNIGRLQGAREGVTLLEQALLNVSKFMGAAASLEIRNVADCLRRRLLLEQIAAEEKMEVQDDA